MYIRHNYDKYNIFSAEMKQIKKHNFKKADLVTLEL